MKEKAEHTEQKETGEMLQYIVANMATKDDFATMQGQIDGIEKRMDIGFAEVDKKFINVDKYFTKVNKTVDKIYKMLDKDVANRTKDEMERASLSVQVDRHESWIKTIAKGTQIELAAA